MKNINIEKELFFNEETISINLDKFIKDENNKLIIVGSAGSGKTTTSKYFINKYKNIEILELEKITNIDYFILYDFIKTYPNENYKDFFLEKYLNYIKPILINNKKLIIESSSIWPACFVYISELKSELSKYPTIILGTSAIQSAIRFLKRNEKNTTISKMQKIINTNLNVNLYKLLKTFRTEISNTNKIDIFNFLE